MWKPTRFGAFGCDYNLCCPKLFKFWPHSEMMSFGTMVTILVTYWFQSVEISVYPFPTALLALPFGIMASILLCLVIDRFVFKFYRGQNSSSVTYLIVSIELMFVIGGVIRFVIGPNDRNFQDGERFIFSARRVQDLEWSI